jgi:hypothetical protein
MAYTTINKGSSYFNTLTYTGNGSSQSITGVGFKPDFIWGKARGATSWHNLTDAVRGVSRPLFSNTTNAEANYSGNQFTSFNTDGFTVVDDSVNTYGCNGTGYTYVAWNWLAANSTASNTNGSITSTVSANTTSGFSIVSYTGNGTANATVGHGLGTIPAMIIIKNRTSVVTWQIFQQSLSWTTQYMQFDTSAVHNDGATYGLKSNPTSTTFQFVTNDLGNNKSGENYVAYCFSQIKGYSKFGSYTGNGSSDGTFVYTGFKPAFLMVKRTDASGDNWFLYDNKRPGYNLTVNRLYPNLSNSEDSNADYGYDLLSNGFKVRTSNTGWNASGGNYIYMAFAENPFVTSGGIPVTAR